MRTTAQRYGQYKGKLKKLWHESPMYWEAYNRAKVRPGVLRCEKCGRVARCETYGDRSQTGMPASGQGLTWVPLGRRDIRVAR
jgi:hypothetical protein